MNTKPNLTRLEYWNDTTGSWWLAHSGINLLDVRGYVERLAANGTIARATVLGPDLESLEVIQFGQPTPSSAGEEEWEEDARESLPDGFVPALNKLEAVNRLSAVTGSGVQVLGPGSKERKSVLDGLARALDMDTSLLALSKSMLARSIAIRLGQRWGDDCFSAGETLTLAGLNVLLHGAESHFSRSIPAAGPFDEARRIAAVIEPVLRRHRRFELKAAVEQMRLEESSQWRQSEWPGWYFEHIALSPCFGALGGRPRKSPTTTFDFSANHIWDFKTHSDHGHVAPLNDQTATHWALGQGGLGFVILTGHAEFEDWARPWLEGQKTLYPAKRRSSTDRRTAPRRIKSAFTPNRVDFVFFQDQVAWDEAVDAGVVKAFQTDWKQFDGMTPRNAKYSLDLKKAVDRSHVMLSIPLN